ncbi:MAG: signal recognition particle-docking protein FtsY [Chloroflexota bacterium]
MVFNRWFNIDKGVEKTRQGFFGKIAELFTQESIDDDIWDELEEALLGADVGVQTTDVILGNLRERVEGGAIRSNSELKRALQEALVHVLMPAEAPAELLVNGLNVVLIVGVNGVGKTTSIVKLANLWTQEGHRVLLAGGDTFRAAAIEQLKIWGDRADVMVVAHQHGADPGAVVFDAITAAKSRGANVVLVDTAGRLHTKTNLMEELRKIRRVIDRHGAEKVTSILVLDATTGQNGISQAKSFRDAAGLDGIILTKLDGTARGGVIFPIVQELKLPILYLGTGETLEDISVFDADAFVSALLKEPNRV